MSDAEERKARGEHILVASGCCGLLHLLLPGLVPSSSATVSPSTCEVPLRLAGWLALPLLRLADSVKKTPFYTTMVGPERLGVALDAAMVRAGLSSEAKATPLAPSVLRLQLFRAAVALYPGPTGACFVVGLSDLYLLVEHSEEGEEGSEAEETLRVRAEEDLDARVTGPAADDYWGCLTWGALASEDGTLGGVAFLEGVLWPRFLAEDCVAGFRKRLQPLVLQMIPRSEYTLLEGLGREVLAEGIAQGLGDLLPLPMEVETYHPAATTALLAATRALARIRAGGSSTSVSLHEIKTVVTHYPTIAAAVGRQAASAVVLGQASELVRLALGLEAKMLTLGHLGAAEKAIDYLRESVEAQSQKGVSPPSTSPGQAPRPAALRAAPVFRRLLPLLSRPPTLWGQGFVAPPP